VSFKIKLILSYVIILAVSFGAVAYFLDKNLEEDSLRDIKSSLVIKAALIREQISSERLKVGDDSHLEVLAINLGAMAACRITIVSPSGDVLADSEKTPDSISSMENHANRPEVKTALAGGTGVDIRYSATLAHYLCRCDLRGSAGYRVRPGYRAPDNEAG
jgi:two-component system, OmpR family, phosphate regulon sensor histidine kinase PhoR